MKKTFKFYLTIWALLVAVFNVIVFIARPIIPGYEVSYDLRFWVAWGFIIAAFVGNLVGAFYTFQTKNLQKTFYRLSVVLVAWFALISVMVVSTIAFIIPNCPAWIAAAVCLTIMAINAFIVVKTLFVASAVEAIDKKIKYSTAYIKGLTASAAGLVDRAKSEEVKEVCKTVYEAVRYSNPMSNDTVVPIEKQIDVQFSAFGEAVDDDDIELVKAVSRELLALIGDRNRMCKLDLPPKPRKRMDKIEILGIVGIVAFALAIITLIFVGVFHRDKYNVIFTDWNGDELKIEVVYEGDSASAPDAPARNGYRFLGWSKAFDKIKGDCIIVAQYVQQVNVKFVDQDGNEISTQIVDRGGSAVAPTAPARAGYSFTGWSKAFDKVESDLVVIAQYTKN